MTEPECPQKSPYVMEVEPGNYAWCSCGRSANQPYCDGSHKGSGMKPIVVNLEEKQRVAWCGCKRSGGQPYCDGSHRSL